MRVSTVTRVVVTRVATRALMVAGSGVACGVLGVRPWSVGDRGVGGSSLGVSGVVGAARGVAAGGAR